MMNAYSLLSRRLPPSYSKLKNAQGFTLIELLVVIIIVGVLAAIAIPNVMSQIGKAREGEGKSIIGALNRAQQAYMFEQGAFSPSENPKDYLDIPVGKEKYYDVIKLVPNEGVQFVHNSKNAENNTRDFVGAVQYAKDTRSFSNIVCRVDKGVDITTHAEATGILNSQYGIQTTYAALNCQNNASEIQ